jgi:hypothetical protein
VATFAYLYKPNAVLQPIDDFLPAPAVPPLYCEIILATRCYYPIRAGLTQDFLQRSRLLFFVRAQMDIALEFRRLYLKFQSIIQILDEAMNEVVRRSVRPVD